MRTLSPLAAALLLFACDAPGASDAGVDAGGDAGPPTCTVLHWAPGSGQLDRWPEPALVVEDATTETGVRLRYVEEDYATLSASLRGYLPVFTEDLAELDGFGVTAESFFMFGRAFDPNALPTAPTSEATAGLGLLVLSEASPRLVTVTVDTTDEQRTLLITPSVPLPARATVAAFVTRELTAAAGGCLEPSPAMAAELAAPSAEQQQAIDALVAAGAIGSAQDLIALTVFPTQSIEEDTLAVAEDISARPVATPSEATCVDEATMRVCDLTIPTQDYRDDDGVFRRAAGEGATPTRSYDLPVRIFLPLTGEAPFPTLFFAHALGGDREQARLLADFAAPRGIATVAVPALQHGAHPANESEATDEITALLNFFAIGDVTHRLLHGAQLREHFRQTSWDRLQLTRWLERSPDLDGDGDAELDGARLMYLGVSLGGMMGPEVLSMTDAYEAAVLVIAGGRVSTIVSESAMLRGVLGSLRPASTTDGDMRRLFPVLQTVIDAGDPAAYAPHVTDARFERAPDPVAVLLGIVLDDDTVPNVSNYALGRALGLPIVEPVIRPEPSFEVLTGPISDNLANGATGGLLQFDRIANGSRAATHLNIADSDVGVGAWFDFLESHLEGQARIRDPYAALGQ